MFQQIKKRWNERKVYSRSLLPSDKEWTCLQWPYIQWTYTLMSLVVYDFFNWMWWVIIYLFVFTLQHKMLVYHTFKSIKRFEWLSKNWSGNRFRLSFTCLHQIECKVILLYSICWRLSHVTVEDFIRFHIKLYCCIQSGEDCHMSLWKSSSDCI